MNFLMGERKLILRIRGFGNFEKKDKNAIKGLPNTKQSFYLLIWILKLFLF